MKIVLEFRDPTPTHCDVSVFVNGAFTGTLRMRQSEISCFHQIVSNGCGAGIDTFLSKGNPDPPTHQGDS